MNCVRPISLEMVAADLVGLESDLPTEVLGGQSFSTWHQWRNRVRKVETAAGLASEVNALAFIGLSFKLLVAVSDSRFLAKSDFDADH